VTFSINVLLYTSEFVGPLYLVWNEIYFKSSDMYNFKNDGGKIIYEQSRLACFSTELTGELVGEVEASSF
jgi:hypothetical protein